MAMRSGAVSIPSSDAPGARTCSWLIASQQNLGVLVCDREQLQGRLPRMAHSLLPALHGVQAYVDEPRENRLADVERLPNRANLAGTERLGSRRQFADAQCAAL